jgi:hypothetical protein
MEDLEHRARDRTGEYLCLLEYLLNRLQVL